MCSTSRLNFELCRDRLRKRGEREPEITSSYIMDSKGSTSCSRASIISRPRVTRRSVFETQRTLRQDYFRLEQFISGHTTLFYFRLMTAEAMSGQHDQCQVASSLMPPGRWSAQLRACSPLGYNLKVELDASCQCWKVKRSNSVPNDPTRECRTQTEATNV